MLVTAGVAKQTRGRDDHPQSPQPVRVECSISICSSTHFGVVRGEGDPSYHGFASLHPRLPTFNPPGCSLYLALGVVAFGVGLAFDVGLFLRSA